MDKILRKPELFPMHLEADSFRRKPDTIWVRAIVYFLSQLPMVHKEVRDHQNLESSHKAMETWTRAGSSKSMDSSEGQVEMWYELSEVNGNRVLYEIHYLFIASGEKLVSRNELIYRSENEISQTLSDAGFSVESIYGDWNSNPVTSSSPEMLFVAKRN